MQLAALITISRTRRSSRRKLTLSASSKEYRGTYVQLATMAIVRCFHVFMEVVNTLKPSAGQAQSSATSTSSMMKWRLAGATLCKTSKIPASSDLSL